MNKFFVVIFIFSYAFFSAQVKQINEIDSLISISNTYLNKNLDSANYFQKKALTLSEKIGNNYYKARCLYNLANINYLWGRQVISKKHCDEAIYFAEKSSNIKILARANNLLGLISYEDLEYNTSYKYFKESLDYTEKNKEYDLLALIYNNIGNLFLSKKDTTNAIKNYQSSLQIAQKNKDTIQLIFSNTNLGTLESIRNKNLAEKYYCKAFLLAQKTNNIEEQFNIRINQTNLYLNKTNIAKNEKAVTFLTDAEKLLKNMNNPDLYFYLYFNYGGYYRNKGDLSRAEEYYNLANNLYKYEVIPYEQKISLLKNLMEIYQAQGNYDKAYFYGTQYHIAKDSIFSLEKEKDFNRLQTKYEVEKKNNQIQLLSKEKLLEKQKRNIWIGSLIGILLFSISFFIFRYQNQKKIHLKNQEISHNKGIIEGQIEERNRVSKELHDGVAGNLIGINHILVQENKNLQNPKLTEINTHLKNIYDEVREISHNLNHDFIESQTFTQLLSRLKTNYEKKNIFDIEIIVFPENALDGITRMLKIDLYRIFQEVFTNIQKHSQAKNVEISFTLNKNHLNIIIDNDGSGLQENSSEGIGIKNIKKRLQNYRGNFFLEKNSNQRTTTIIDLYV